MNFYKNFMKRIFDIIFASFTIVLISPLFLLILILVRYFLGKPAIYKQKRPGLNEKIFTLYKFRTMTNEIDENGDLLPNNLRLTKFGKMLRSTSLDELPELLNILKGEMSFVGPRPLLVEYLPLYNEKQKKRHTVRPGLTGLAQVNGRNSISWEEKFDFDIYYINNISFLLDCKILFSTIVKVFKRQDINSNDSVTMEKFKGSRGIVRDSIGRQ